MQTKSKLVALGFIENKNGQFLLSQRHEPKLPEVHLKWDLPGGKNEFNETLEDTLRREILEETGLKIEILGFVPKTIAKVWDYGDHKQHTLILCFHCKMISGKLHLKDHKINDLKWVSKKDLNGFDLLPTTEEFINIIDKP